jgi:hypothetical protein
MTTLPHFPFELSEAQKQAVVDKWMSKMDAEELRATAQELRAAASAAATEKRAAEESSARIAATSAQTLPQPSNRIDDDRDEIGLQLTRTRGNIKDFGSTTAIWSQGFLNYLGIFFSFFGAQSQGLHNALLRFHGKIIDLAEIYEWQGAVLPLALDHHSNLCSTGPTEIEQWELPRHSVDRYCSADKVRVKSTTLKRSAPDSSLTKNAKRPDTNNDSVICRTYNSLEGCNFKWCNRAHKCSTCGSKQHGREQCKNKQ